MMDDAYNYKLVDNIKYHCFVQYFLTEICDKRTIALMMEAFQIEA